MEPVHERRRASAGRRPCDGEDRAERGDAGGDPDLAERVVDPRRHPGALHGRRSNRGRRERRVDEADPDTAEHEAGQQHASSPSSASTRLISQHRERVQREPEREQQRGSARAPSAGPRAAPRRTRRARAAGSARRSRAATARGCSAGRASGRGTSRTSTTRSRTPSTCAPTNAGRRNSARSIIVAPPRACGRDERGEQHDGGDEERDDRARSSSRASLPSISAEDQAEEPAGERHEPERVEPAVLRVARLAQLRSAEHDRGDRRSGC